MAVTDSQIRSAYDMASRSAPRGGVDRAALADRLGVPAKRVQKIVREYLRPHRYGLCQYEGDEDRDWELVEWLMTRYDVGDELHRVAAHRFGLEMLAAVLGDNATYNCAAAIEPRTMRGRLLKKARAAAACEGGRRGMYTFTARDRDRENMETLVERLEFTKADIHRMGLALAFVVVEACAEAGTDAIVLGDDTRVELDAVARAAGIRGARR